MYCIPKLATMHLSLNLQYIELEKLDHLKSWFIWHFIVLYFWGIIQKRNQHYVYIFSTPSGTLKLKNKMSAYHSVLMSHSTYNFDVLLKLKVIDTFTWNFYSSRTIVFELDLQVFQFREAESLLNLLQEWELIKYPLAWVTLP